jgi:hypothetical protein
MIMKPMAVAIAIFMNSAKMNKKKSKNGFNHHEALNLGTLRLRRVTIFTMTILQRLRVLTLLVRLGASLHQVERILGELLGGNKNVIHDLHVVFAEC